MDIFIINGYYHDNGLMEYQIYIRNKLHIKYEKLFINYLILYKI